MTAATESAPTLWILTVAMLIARLEIFVFLFGLARIGANIRDIRRNRRIRQKEWAPRLRKMEDDHG